MIAFWLKRAVNSELIYPRFSILNPELPMTLPPFQVACGAMDISAHLMERYFTNVKNVSFTDRLIEGTLATLREHWTDLAAGVVPRPGVLHTDSVLELLAGRGINEVHAEAGATLAGAFIAAGLADEVLLYVAPVLLGDQARPLFGGLGIQAMADRLKLEIVDSRMIGEDHRLLLQPAR